MDDPDGRLTDLEMRYTYLERTISELDEVVVELRRRLERAERELSLVKHTALEHAGETPPNEKPPHY